MAFSIWAKEPDTLKQQNILEAFHHGHLKGQVRDYTMLTVNRGSGKDYFAQAIGASLHYETAEFYGVSLGLKGIFIHRVFSNELSGARFERQLFDLENPTNYNELDRLEELYLNYRFNGVTLRLGKMDVNSPIVNKHDGRMKPKMYSGIMGRWNLKKNHGLHFYYLSKASPRSTVDWFNLTNAIGIYNNGYDRVGEHLHYHGALDTKALVLLGYNGKLFKTTRIKLWDYYLENLINTTQVDIEHSFGKKYEVKLMYLGQQRVVWDGSKQNELYVGDGQLTHVVSALAEADLDVITVDLMGTYVFDKGQYLFPRELGVDPFYTSITRNWLEGLSDAAALGLSLKKHYSNWDFKLSYVHLESQNDFSKNKYMELSNEQLNVDVVKHFHHALEGLDLRFLYVLKHSGGELPSYANVVNRTNYHHVNLIMNFNF